MTEPAAIPALCRRLATPHEALDAYWFAQMLRCRMRRVAAAARCQATTGRLLDSAVGRAVRFIGQAADGTRANADAGLARAYVVLDQALILVDDLSLEGVCAVVIADLRERTLVLRARLQQLEGTAVETWPASNHLPTVLDEAKEEARGDAPVDHLVALAKLPDAALRDLPVAIVAQDRVAQRPAKRNALAAPLVQKQEGEEVASGKAGGIVRIGPKARKAAARRKTG